MSNRGHALSREEMVRTLTAYSGTTTGAGAADGSSLIDSRLINENDFLTGKSVLILSGAAKWETAGISSFEPDTGELSLSPALNSRIVAGVAFRVLNTLPESLHITSGIVQIQGYDYVSGEYRLVAVNESGQIEIKATVADIVTAKISGEVVHISGQVVQTSGQSILISGQTVKVSGQTVIAKISGEAVHVSSGHIHVVSGQVVAKISGQSVVVTSGQVVAKISGEAVHVSSGHIHVVSGQVISKVSGETVIAKVSGQMAWVGSGHIHISSGQVIAKISGEAVHVSSGHIHVVSGQVIAKVSGQVVKVSGQIVDIRTPTAILTGAIKPITDDSGGVELATGAVKAAQVKALGTNSGVILIGSSGQRPWYEATCSGLGFVLDPGEVKSEDIDNFNKIYLVAQVSGDQVSYLGVN